MAQLVTRIDDGLLEDIDALVAAGAVESRSDAVRRALHALIEAERRRLVGEAIRAGYSARPQTEAEFGWADGAAARMIADETW